VLLTLSAAIPLYAGTESLTAVTRRDQKVVRRWSLPGDPRGIALGTDGIAYIGLAKPQAVIAVDARSGRIKKRVVLDSEEIASTKELVTVRLNRAGTRLFIANGIDESVTILALPGLGVVREITIEGEPIRDALPDPTGRYLFLLGRRVHIYDGDGKSELRTINLEDPTAIAVTASGSTLAVVAPAVVALYDTNTFEEIARHSLPTEKQIDAALFAAGDRVLMALSPNMLYQKLLARQGTAINRERICLPEGSGPQIAALVSPELLLFAERRCSNGGFAGSSQLVAPASLYGVNAYAVAYDPTANLLYTTERAGYLTIYRVPRAAVAH
jgi:hypothetical protein